MDKILITGASGFLGWNLALMLSSHFRVYGIYLDHQVFVSSVETFAFDLVNLSQIERMCDAVQPDVIIHTAAVTNPDYCELHHNEVLAVNTFATRELAKAANYRRIRLIYVSTDLVFDGAKGEYSEADSPLPQSYYGKTKYLGELEVSNNCSNYVILRLSVLYGRGNGVKQCFFEKLEQFALRGEPCNLFTDQFRSPLFIEDAVEAIYRLAETKNEKGLFHLGGPERMSWFEFGQKIRKIYDFPEALLIPSEIGKSNLRAPRPADCSLLSAKIQKTLGLQLTPVEVAISKLYHRHGSAS